MIKKSNNLAQETSLYLQQHAHNPVDWYPWGEKAFQIAKKENKPILLSIGYSACHWCHVMAHESFEDAETANLMNKFFVSIKVDREQRPDIDKIYQTAHQILTGQAGGWPLTIFLNPENNLPFFSGTYFPPKTLHGLPAFKEVLIKIADFFHKNPSAIAKQNSQLQEVLQRLAATPHNPHEILTEQPLHAAYQQLSENYDGINGGFGSAPKFPQPTNIERLLRYGLHATGQQQEDQTALSMAKTTLIKMAQGGIYDQIGGGFFRYSVDAQWRIPHFEKMLYDNAQLLHCYSQANLIQTNPLFESILHDTSEWALREMQDTQGGFYATLDADSEHHEGKYYYWDRDEVKKLLTEDEYHAIAAYYGLDQPPNFEKHWHFYIVSDLTEINPVIKSAQKKLLQARNQRIRPACDQKILTSWNGLMIKGLALTGYTLNNDHLIIIAQRTLDFIRNKLWVNQRLFACYQENKASIPGFLDDYVFLLDGILTLLQIRWRLEDLYFAIEIADSLLKYFHDQNHGGFFFTANDSEKLIQRPKSFLDEAVPSSNGIAALALARLGHLLAETKYIAASEKTLKAAWPAIMAIPSAHGSLLNALEEYLYPPQIIILVGKLPVLTEWQTLCKKYYQPRRLVFAIPADDNHLPDVMKKLIPINDETVAYICSGMQCSQPIKDLKKLEEILK